MSVQLHLGDCLEVMRSMPDKSVDAVRRNSYVGENWSNELLTRYMRYWSNLKITGAFSFGEYKRREKLTAVDENQLRLL